MCMKYVNVNVCCFDDINNNFLNLGRTTFTSMLESVKSKERNDKFIIGGFNIVTFVNIRGTRDGNNSNNPLDSDKRLDFKIRLTKLDAEPSKQLSYDLKDFSVDLSNKVSTHHACFDYKEHIEIVNVDTITLDSKGAYVIKVLVKEDSDNLYNVQMIHPLYVQ